MGEGAKHKFNAPLTRFSGILFSVARAHNGRLVPKTGKPGTDHGFIRRKPWSVPGFAAGFVAVALGLAGMMAKGFHWL